jgi:hypothetical protein
MKDRWSDIPSDINHGFGWRYEKRVSMTEINGRTIYARKSAKSRTFFGKLPGNTREWVSTPCGSKVIRPAGLAGALSGFFQFSFCLYR